MKNDRNAINLCPTTQNPQNIGYEKCEKQQIIQSETLKAAEEEKKNDSKENQKKVSYSWSPTVYLYIYIYIYIDC